MYSFYDLMENGGTNNPGFRALPDYVQNQILANMAYGGYYNPYMAEGGKANGGSIFSDNPKKVKFDPSTYKSRPDAESSEIKSVTNSLLSAGDRGANSNDFNQYSTTINKYANMGNDTSYMYTRNTPIGTEEFFHNTNQGNPISQLRRGNQFINLSPDQVNSYKQKVLTGTGGFEDGGSTFSGNAWYQEGGEEGAAQQEQIMQIIQMYAQLTEMEPEAVLEELQGMEEEDQQQALQSMVEQIQSAQGQQQEAASEEQGQMAEDDAEEEYMKRGGQPTFYNGAMYQTGGYIPEYGEMAYGGIHINPANKGKFTASAKSAGMGVQEFASHVLANKEDYSSTQVKRANFAHNAAGWSKAMGGPIVGQEMEVTPKELENLRKQGYQFQII